MDIVDTLPKMTPAGGSQVALDLLLARMQNKLMASPMQHSAATNISGMNTSKRRSNSDAEAIWSVEYSKDGATPP